MGFHIGAYVNPLDSRTWSLNVSRQLDEICRRGCERILPSIIEASGSSLTHACLVCGSVYCVLRYPLLTVIATRYQFNDVAMPPTIETTRSSLTHTCRDCVGLPVVCALSVVLRYPLLTAIATRYQFTVVAMPPIIESSRSSLTHTCGECVGLPVPCALSVVLR